MASWLLASEPICLADPGSAQPAWPVAPGRGARLGQGAAPSCSKLLPAGKLSLLMAWMLTGVMEQRGKPPWSRGCREVRALGSSRCLYWSSRWPFLAGRLSLVKALQVWAGG